MGTASVMAVICAATAAGRIHIIPTKDKHSRRILINFLL